MGRSRTKALQKTGLDEGSKYLFSVQFEVCIVLPVETDFVSYDLEQNPGSRRRRTVQQINF